MGPIVVATGNPHKLEELRAILGPLGIELLSLADAGDTGPEPDEPGSTFEENAALKALAYAVRTARLCLADDSGLEVDALGGAPGVISARYHSDGRETDLPRAERDRLNNERLLRDLRDVPLERRGGRFVCAMALAGPPPSRGRGLSGPVSPPPPLAKRWLTPAGLHTRTSDLLPHWEHGGSTYFLTFCVRSGSLTEAERAIVLAASMHWHQLRVRVHLVVVMPDHVHLIVTPLRATDDEWVSIPWLMQSVKGFTASKINALRNTSGPFWQDEYFDRIIRSADEYAEIVEYTGMNPIRAGLVDDWRKYPFMAGEEIEERERRRRGLKGPAPRDQGPSPTNEGRSPFEESARGLVALVRGTFEGRIGLPGDVPRGSNGFGYDPLFLVAPGFTRTSAELSADEKNRVSHRGNAARALAAAISELLRSGA